MRTFAQKQNRPQLRTSHNITRLRLVDPDANHQEHPVLHLQRTVGNQSVQRLLQATPNDHEITRFGAAVPAPASELSSQNFTRVGVQSKPPTELPPAPKPKKDEKPLGTLKDKVTGAEEKIYESFVTPGLWWFNGGTPTIPDLYPTTANIPVASLGKGNFTVKVTTGSDKVALNGSGATMTGKDLTKVTVKTLAPSTKQGDVTIEVKHRAPGATNDTTNNVKFEVRAPSRLDLLGTDHLAAGAYGYASMTWLRTFDNFGKPMPYIDVNEDFSTGTVEKGVSSEWKDAIAARTKGKDMTRSNAVFQDKYGAALSGAPPASMTPKPSNPGSPLSKTRVGSFSHDWYVGSPTTGKGVHVSHHVGVFYADHGEYTMFKSPPAAAKAAAGKP